MLSLFLDPIGKVGRIPLCFGTPYVQEYTVFIVNEFLGVRVPDGGRVTELGIEELEHNHIQLKDHPFLLDKPGGKKSRNLQMTEAWQWPWVLRRLEELAGTPSLGLQVATDSQATDIPLPVLKSHLFPNFYLKLPHLPEMTT